MSAKMRSGHSNIAYGEGSRDDFSIDTDAKHFKVTKGGLAKAADKKIDKRTLVRGTKRDVVNGIAKIKDAIQRLTPRTITARLVNDGLCPCGCGKTVPNRCHYATKKCGKRYREQMGKIGGNSHPCWTGRTRLEKKATRPQYTAAALTAGD